MKIYLEPFDKNWVSLFENEALHLSQLFYPLKPCIEHIGSTALADGLAKPIIDILVGFDNKFQIEHYTGVLIQNDYIYYELYNTAFPERRHFVKVDGHLGITQVSKKEDDVVDQMALKRKFHLHVTTYQSVFWKRHIAFREHLKKDKADRIKYFDLKKKLSKQDWENMQFYAESKTEFIRNIEQSILPNPL